MLNYLQYAEKYSSLSKENFDLLYYQLDKCVWCHSDYWRNSLQIYKTIELNCNCKSIFSLQKSFAFIKSIITRFRNFFLLKKEIKNDNYNEIVICRSYFNFKADFPFCCFDLFDFSFLDVNKYKNDIKLIMEVEENFKTEGLNYFLSSEMNEKINQLKESLIRIYSSNKVKAFFTYADSDFWSRILILVFKKLNKPTFLYVHGMPGIYKSVYNRSDFLLVWSEKMKRNFIDAGMPKEKIILWQNKKYAGITASLKKVELSSVVVLGYTIPGSDPCCDKTRTFQRNFGLTLLYADLVKNTLLKLGIKRAILRPHPSENHFWYIKNVDTSFYSIDNSSSDDECLEKASLIIGPTSTMIVNSLYHGVPYILFEPVLSGEELSIFGLVPPFDGTDSFVPLCRTEAELYSAIKEGKSAKQELFFEYNTKVDEYDRVITIIKGLKDE